MMFSLLPQCSWTDCTMYNHGSCSIYLFHV